jgi:dGTPase
MNKNIVETIKAELEKLRVLSDRQHDDPISDKHRPWTSVYRRDHARILYSSEFRRLSGKMQLFAVDPKDFYRTRLTHSLEVAQIARSICITLNEKHKADLWQLDDLFLIEAISLAHDWGNPPFGHAGERVLNELAKDIGGFEGNAQTLRIITTLAQKRPVMEGLNLTKRAILGVVKHFRKYDECPNNNHKFLYPKDYDLVKTICDNAGIDLSMIKMTLDCQIMNLADEIAYASHDLEDTLRLKYLNVNDLMYFFECLFLSPDAKQEEENAAKALRKLKKIVGNAKNLSGLTELIRLNYKSFDYYETIFRKELSSQIVYYLINDVILRENNGILELGLENYDFLKNTIKDILYPALKNTTEKLVLYEKAGEKVLNGLFEVYADNQFNKDNELLGQAYRGRGNLQDYERKRFIVDYISGMTESFAIEQYKYYFGSNPFEEGLYTNYRRRSEL